MKKRVGGRVVMYDAIDHGLLSGFKWSIVNGYVMGNRNQMRIYMHRLITGAGPKELVDHVNRNPLDNRASNLRMATPSQNGSNRGPDRRRHGSSSRHKGVSWSKDRGKWQTSIHINGKTRALGRFDSELDAARAYNAAAVEVWGEFARLNDV